MNMRSLPTILKFNPLLLLVFLTIGNAHSQDSAPVWKIDDGENTLYLGGTIHVLSDQDYPLPWQFDSAYRETDAVVLEADLKQINDPANLPLVMSHVMYTDGRTLKSVLSPEVYGQLDQYAKAKGLSMALLNPMKPGMAMVTLLLLELQAQGLYGKGVDEHFGNRATEDGKPLSFLERMDEQLQFLSSIGDGVEDQWVSYNLSEMEKLATIFTEMKTAWRSGDLEKLEALFLDTLKQEFSSIYQELVVDRNRNWQPEILQMLASPEVEFVLVGALHLVGDEGLLVFLENQGFTVEQLR